jgi:hypothetical protein
MKDSPQIVRQHFVPACYLARFTLQGERSSPFFVHSPDGAPVREDIPDHVGFERHYHDINVPGFRPDHLEFEFQKIEGRACALFKTLSATPGRRLLTEDEKETVLFFFAVQAGRVPQAKDKYEKLIVDAARSFMEAFAHRPEFFSRAMAAAKRQGIEIDPIERERLIEAVDGGHIIPYADKTQVSVGILRLAYAVLDQVDGMHYTLLYSDGPDWFVCSDYPAGIFYSVTAGDTLEYPTNIENPTIQLLTKSKTTYVPLAYNVALMIHQHDDRPVALTADQRMVAIVNTITISHAQRFICSPTNDFVCVLPDRRLGNAREAVEALVSFASNEA